VYYWNEYIITMRVRAVMEACLMVSSVLIIQLQELGYETKKNLEQ